MKRTITLKYAGQCACCGAPMPAGELATFDSVKREITHAGGIKGECFSVLNEKANGVVDRWFIVVGRRWGDDEATALKIGAPDKNDAANSYRAQMSASDNYTETKDNDGPGTVWVDHIFDCGIHEPKEVS